jgi:hypothetical protein
MRQAFFFAIVLASYAGCAPSQGADDPKAKQSIVIPLKDIWAWHMPDTKDVRELDPDSFGRGERAITVEERDRRFTESRVQSIIRTLDSLPGRRTQQPKAGFAVQGKEMQALREAHGIFVDKQTAQKVFSPGSELSVVFFSHPSKYSIEIVQIKKLIDPIRAKKSGGRTIEVHYRFVPDKMGTYKEHFALIPVGKISEGSIAVKWVQSPGTDQSDSKSRNDSAYVAATLCKEFTIVGAKGAQNEIGAATWPTEAEAIPLSDVWAWNISGTRPMDGSRHGTEYASPEGRLLDEIRVALQLPFVEPKVAKSGFAVSGADADALREAHAVLANHQPPPDSFPADSTISIVFFSHKSTYYCHLDGAEIHGHRIRVPYRFIPHQTDNITSHFALIPLGKLAPGKYTVEMDRMPMGPEYLHKNYHDLPLDEARRIVCKSFSFTVSHD